MCGLQKNIAVIGAGVMGLSAAHVLCKDGHAVTVYDAGGFPADNASAMAGGMLAPYSEIEHMDGAWIEAGLAGVEFWRVFEGGCGFQQNGSLLIAHEEDRYILERFRGHLPPEKQALQSAAALEPDLEGCFASGLYLEEEAHLTPSDALSELCRLVRDMGAVLKEEAGEPNALADASDFVLDCRGMAVDDPDLRGVKGETLIVQNPEFTLSRPVRLMHPRYSLYIVPRGEGLFMIGATQVESEGACVSLRSAMELMSALYSLHPSFGEAEVLEMKAGIRPSYADNLPKIKVSGNVLSCNGLFRHGYLLGPVMAGAVADKIAGRDNEFISLFMGEEHDESDRQRAA